MGWTRNQQESGEHEGERLLPLQDAIMLHGILIRESQLFQLGLIYLPNYQLSFGEEPAHERILQIFLLFVAFTCVH